MWWKSWFVAGVALVMVLFRRSDAVPLMEMTALHDLYTSTRGEHWTWFMPLIGVLSSRWDFSVNSSSGDYLYDPCGGINNLRWQGLFCNDSSISRILLVNFNLTGTLPESIGNFGHLATLQIFYNRLSGSIPSTIGKMEKLNAIDLNYNSFTNSLPSGFVMLQSLQFLYMTDNSLTGTIPSELGSMTNLEFIHLANNSFTGTLPSSLGNLRGLLLLTFDYNLFTGPIPAEYGQLSKIEDIGLSNCDLSGTIPTELSELSSVLYFFIQSNLLTGTLPAELGMLTKVYWFGVSFNILTGTIPSELGNLVNVGDLYMDANMFSGTVPLEFSRFSALEVMRLQRNLLTGDLNGRLDNMLLLRSMDFSDNRLSGSIPPVIFELPSIDTIALSLNCFHGELPETMCNMYNATVLSMDGLGAARHCKNEEKVPLTGITVNNLLQGTLAGCVWKSPQLQVLHLTGNGLTGSIPDVIPPESALQSISLSHNKLTGTIPISLQKLSFALLDLSYNKITGELDIWSAGNKTLILEVNRLSGQFPEKSYNHTSHYTIHELKALRGNLFSCEYVPSQDLYSEDYTCGSENLENATYAFIASLGFSGIFMVTLLMLAFKKILKLPFALDILKLYTRHRLYISYVEATTNKAVQKIKLFSLDMRKVSKMILALLTVYLTTCFPFFAVKLYKYCSNSSYTTHSYQYGWVFSASYVKGTLPAVLLMAMWLAVMVIMIILIKTKMKFRLLSNFPSSVDWSEQQTATNTQGNHEIVELTSFKITMLQTAVLFFNGSIVGTANGFYIYLSNQALLPSLHLTTQVCMALFNVMWNMMIVPLLAKALMDPAGIVRIELKMLVFNNILLPCIATALSSPSCFQGLLFAPDDVDSLYQYSYCARTSYNGNETVCTSTSLRTVFVSPLEPPFSYDNMCTSTILTSFIPVYVLVYAIQLLVMVASVVILTNTSFAQFPLWLQRGMPGVFWPSHEWNLCDYTPQNIFKFAEVVSFDILNQLAVFVTFGITTPYLALILSFVVLFKLYLWRVLSCRFAYIRLSDAETNPVVGVGKNSSDPGVTLLNAACTPIMIMIEQNLRPIVFSSALFFSFLCWDVAGDEVGWRSAFWAPTSIMMVPLLLWALKFLHHDNKSDAITDITCHKEKNNQSFNFPSNLSFIDTRINPILESLEDDVEMSASRKNPPLSNEDKLDEDVM